jgi:hypothetical protein
MKFYTNWVLSIFSVLICLQLALAIKAKSESQFFLEITNKHRLRNLNTNTTIIIKTNTTNQTTGEDPECGCRIVHSYFQKPKKLPKKNYTRRWPAKKEIPPAVPKAPERNATCTPEQGKKLYENLITIFPQRNKRYIKVKRNRTRRNRTSNPNNGTNKISFTLSPGQDIGQAIGNIAYGSPAGAPGIPPAGAPGIPPAAPGIPPAAGAPGVPPAAGAPGAPPAQAGAPIPPVPAAGLPGAPPAQAGAPVPPVPAGNIPPAPPLPAGAAVPPVPAGGPNPAAKNADSGKPDAEKINLPGVDDKGKLQDLTEVLGEDGQQIFAAAQRYQALLEDDKKRKERKMSGKKRSKKNRKKYTLEEKEKYQEMKIKQDFQRKARKECFDKIRKYTDEKFQPRYVVPKCWIMGRIMLRCFK